MANQVFYDKKNNPLYNPGFPGPRTCERELGPLEPNLFNAAASAALMVAVVAQKRGEAADGIVRQAFLYGHIPESSHGTMVGLRYSIRVDQRTGLKQVDVLLSPAGDTQQEVVSVLLNNHEPLGAYQGVTRARYTGDDAHEQLDRLAQLLDSKRCWQVIHGSSQFAINFDNTTTTVTCHPLSGERLQ